MAGVVHIDNEMHRQFALRVLQQLREAGYQALFAGGCVRDQLLGNTPKDYDVATDATPQQVTELFGKRRTLQVGAAFGVSMVTGPRGAGAVEVTTFRSDAAYSDGRHPDRVTFSTPEEDAQRRDFTINGLFYDPLADEVIDYVGGQDDLRGRVIRAIGDPAARFSEDHLRMLRAVRFTARFNFSLDEATLAAMQRMAHDLGGVSAERIAQEMRLMLAHASRGRAARLLVESGLANVVLPEVVALVAKEPQCARHADRWQHALAVVDALPHDASFTLALAALLHPADDEHAATATCAVEVARRWRLSNHEREQTVWLVAHQAALAAARRQPWSSIQPLLVAPGGAELVSLREAIVAADHQPLDDVLWCRERLGWPPEQLNPQPLLTGHDLARHGLRAGPQFSTLLQSVRNAQLDGEISTPGAALALVERLLHDEK